MPGTAFFCDKKTIPIYININRGAKTPHRYVVEKCDANEASSGLLAE